MTHVSDYADYHQRVALLALELEAVSDWVFAGEVTVRECLIDYRNVRRLFRIGQSEIAAREQRDVERREISGTQHVEGVANARFARQYPAVDEPDAAEAGRGLH